MTMALVDPADARRAVRPGAEHQVQVTGDAELVRCAQSGEIGALGLLLARYRPLMQVVALSILGYRHDLDDAVQESCITAMLRITDLRDPEAVVGWLRTIVRNQCLMQLRVRADVPADDLEMLAPASSELDPAEIVARQGLGNWVWQALDGLSPALQVVTMLRYFTAVTSYEQIAQVCSIPVGTVRSRLNQARVDLARGLSAATDLPHHDAAAFAERRRQEAEQTLTMADQGSFAQALAERWSPELVTLWPKGRRTLGHDYLVRVTEAILEDGVLQRLANVVAGRKIVIWETDFINPAHDPSHCPPSALWVQQLEGGMVKQLRVFHPVGEWTPPELGIEGDPEHIESLRL